MEDDLQPAKAAGLAEELAELRALTTQLRAENAVACGERGYNGCWS